MDVESALANQTGLITIQAKNFKIDLCLICYILNVTSHFTTVQQIDTTVTGREMCGGGDRRDGREGRGGESLTALVAISDLYPSS